jgi:hypothetical protein
MTSLPDGDEEGAGAGLAGYSSSFFLFHIQEDLLPFLNKMSLWYYFAAGQANVLASRGKSSAMGSLEEDVGLSAGWISRRLESSGYRADFRPNSLREIDRFFDDAELRDLPPDELAAEIFAIGAYIGEVVRRARGGEWLAPDTVLVLPDGTRCGPVQRAMQRLLNGRRDSIEAWGVSLGLRAGPLPVLRRVFWKLVRS